MKEKFYGEDGAARDLVGNANGEKLNYNGGGGGGKKSTDSGGGGGSGSEQSGNDNKR